MSSTSPICPENGEYSVSIDQSAETEQNTLIELAALPPLEYDRIRIAKAKELKIRPATLDNIIKINRTTQKKENKTPFPTVKPWHDEAGEIFRPFFS